jgi:hypothetical protein
MKDIHKILMGNIISILDSHKTGKFKESQSLAIYLQAFMGFCRHLAKYVDTVQKKLYGADDPKYLAKF